MSEKKSSWFASGCLVIVVAFALIIFAFAALIGALGSMAQDQDFLSQRHVQGKLEGPGVAIVSASGVMMRTHDGLSDEGITHYILETLKKIRKDSSIKGVVLRLNTPGGSVTDADLIYHEIKRLKKKGTYVLIHMDDICASGGVYAAMAADEIWALPTSITGSIGVIMSALNFAELLQRHGVQDVSITSGANKALLSPTSPVQEAHKKILQEIVQDMYERFVTLVKKGRKLEDQAARAMADGRIFTAQQAKKIKLIDEIGYHEVALKHLLEKTGLPNNARVVSYRKPRSFLSQLSSQWFVKSWQQKALDLAMKPNQAYYLYAPYGVSATALNYLQ